MAACPVQTARVWHHSSHELADLASPLAEGNTDKGKHREHWAELPIRRRQDCLGAARQLDPIRTRKSAETAAGPGKRQF